MVKITIPDHRTVGWNYLYQVAHWRKRKMIADEIHTLVFVFCRNLHLEPIKKRVSIELVAHATRPLDPDNICAKLYIDGLVKAKVLEDDNRKFIEEVTLISEKDKKEWLEIKIFDALEQKCK